MRTKEAIKDYRNDTTGYLITESNGIQKVTDIQGKVLGIYDPKQDVTKDIHGKKLGYGNRLMGLVD